ncbi:hypothetical protein Tco_0758320 [Tanacetum coccineum]
MVAYLEKTDGNAEFHEIIDFLTRNSIHYALTVSPVVSTTFVEQFWMSAKSKIINNVSDLLFDDADGIDSLHNQAIFDAIQLMGHLDAKKKFVMYPRFILVFLTNQLKNVPVPLDHFPINALTTKVFSFMVKKGKSFSRNVTPLFPSMLAQPTEDEGAVSERPSETQPTPSSHHPRNEDGLTLQSVYNLCVSLCKHVTTQAAQIKYLKSQIKQLKKKAKPVISHHNAWIKSVSIKQRLARKKSLKKSGMAKGSYQTERKSPNHSNSTHISVLMMCMLKNAMDIWRQMPTCKRTRKVQEDWEAEEEMKKLAEEEATKAALIQDFDDIQARIEADRLLAARLQEEERETFTVEERAKFLYDTIAAQRRFLAQQRAAAIRSRPPTRTQLRNQMMTYLKHVGGKKHADLKKDLKKYKS